MSSYNQHQPQPQVAYPAPGTGTGPQTTVPAYTTAPPPPAGYPTRNFDNTDSAGAAPAKTQSRGDGFWKGCCAALCCCCVLDACF